MQKLFVEGSVAILKLNPVNDYIGPYLEGAFAELVADGFVRFAYGGATVGQYLVYHPDVDQIHITGAAATHDAIVWDTRRDAVARRDRNDPLLAKPITSELGNVSPVGEVETP